MKHAQTATPEQELAVRRLPIVEQQLADVSRRYVQLHARTRQLDVEALARAAIIRRLNRTVALLSAALRCQLIAARPPAPLDTGTPGVEVTR